jgi:DNA-binding NarL/FixJ family response regulator
LSVAVGEVGAMPKNIGQNPILIIGHDILALGLAAMLRARGVRVVVVRGAEPNGNPLSLPGPRPAAIIIDLLIAKRDDFALLRQLRAMPHLEGVPVLVLSPGTVAQDASALEARLRAFAAQPLLTPHDLDTVLGELERSLASVA